MPSLLEFHIKIGLQRRKQIDCRLQLLILRSVGKYFILNCLGDENTIVTVGKIVLQFGITRVSFPYLSVLTFSILVLLAARGSCFRELLATYSRKHLATSFCDDLLRFI